MLKVVNSLVNKFLMNGLEKSLDQVACLAKRQIRNKVKDFKKAIKSNAKAAQDQDTDSE